MEVTVKDRQSLLDIAVQCLGGVEGVFALAERNGVSVTDRFEDGTVLSFDLSDVVDDRVRETYSNKSLAPATEITEEELLALLGDTGESDSSGFGDALDKVVDDLTEWIEGNTFEIEVELEDDTDVDFEIEVGLEDGIDVDFGIEVGLEDDTDVDFGIEVELED